MKKNTEPFLQMRKKLRLKKQVWQMAKDLGRDKAEIVGRLAYVWEFADERLGPVSDRVEPCEESDLDYIAECPGFARAMEKVGWLILGPGWVEFPGYNEGPGSHAAHEAAKRKQTKAATASKVARQAAKEGAAVEEESRALVKESLTGVVTDVVTDVVTSVVTTHATSVATMPVTTLVTEDNINININNNLNRKHNFSPQPPEAGGSQKNLCQSRKERKRDQRFRERVEALAGLGRLRNGEYPEWWEIWVKHLVGFEDPSRLPSLESARIWFGKLVASSPAEARKTVEGWISRGRYTPDGPGWSLDPVAGLKKAAPLPDQGTDLRPAFVPSGCGSIMREGMDWFTHNRATGAKFRWCKLGKDWVA